MHTFGMQECIIRLTKAWKFDRPRLNQTQQHIYPITFSNVMYVLLQVFTGNNDDSEWVDNDAVVVNDLDVPLITTSIRLNPRGFGGGESSPGLRWEIYGCPCKYIFFLFQ